MNLIKSYIAEKQNSVLATCEAMFFWFEYWSSSTITPRDPIFADPKCADQDLGKMKQIDKDSTEANLFCNGKLRGDVVF